MVVRQPAHIDESSCRIEAGILTKRAILAVVD
jgi:hypothetical protein